MDPLIDVMVALTRVPPNPPNPPAELPEAEEPVVPVEPPDPPPNPPNPPLANAARNEAKADEPDVVLVFESS